MDETGSPDTEKRVEGSRIRRLFRVGAAILVIAFAALAGLVLVPPVVADVGPTTVATRSRIGEGGTTLRVPALGTISASTHPTPVRVDLDIRQVNIEELGALATSPAGRGQLRAVIEEELGSLARRAGLQAIGGSAVLGAIAALILFHRRWLWAVVGFGVGGILALGLMWTTAATYRVEAFEDPTFRGPIGRARTVIEAVGERAELLDEARTRYETAAERMAQLFVVLGSPDRDPRASETVILHVSDIHGNPLAFDLMQQLVTEFDVDAVVDTGDISSSFLDTGELSALGAPVDRVVIGAIQRLNVPYLFVSGNHDSPATVRRLSGVPEIQVLDGTTASVGEIDVFGWGDPTYSVTPVSEEEKADMRAAEAPRVAEQLDDVDSDVLAVHDPVLGSAAVGRVPVILAGHTHDRGLELSGDSIVLTVGSTGATGLKSLTVESEKTYEAELLYFQDDVLVAVDYVQFQNLDGEFSLDRRTF